MVTISEYDRTAFEHDAEFVEGSIVERALPAPPHAILQMYLGYLLMNAARQLGFYPLSELRIRTKPDRTRIPDVCLMYGMPGRATPTKPPYLCIEILSPEDSTSELLTKIDEYLTLGVEYVWVIDPEKLSGAIFTKDGIQGVQDSVFRAGRVEVDIRDVPKCVEED